MPDPSVKSWTDDNGLVHWGAVPATADAKPAPPLETAVGTESGTVHPVTPETQEAPDAAEVPADGDRPDPKPRKR